MRRSFRCGALAALLAALLALTSFLEAYATYSPGPSPVAWWRMNEGTGTALGDTAGGFTANFTGVSGCQPRWHTGGLVAGDAFSVGNADTCGGSFNSWAEVAAPAGLTLPGTWSIDAWYETTAGCAGFGRSFVQVFNGTVSANMRIDAGCALTANGVGVGC